MTNSSRHRDWTSGKTVHARRAHSACQAGQSVGALKLHGQRANQSANALRGTSYAAALVWSFIQENQCQHFSRKLAGARQASVQTQVRARSVFGHAQSSGTGPASKSGRMTQSSSVSPVQPAPRHHKSATHIVSVRVVHTSTELRLPRAAAVSVAPSPETRVQSRGAGDPALAGRHQPAFHTTSHRFTAIFCRRMAAPFSSIFSAPWPFPGLLPGLLELPVLPSRERTAACTPPGPRAGMVPAAAAMARTGALPQRES